MEQKPPKSKKGAKKGFLANLTKKQKISVGTIVIVSIAGIFGGIMTYMILPKGGTCIIGINEVNFEDIDPLVVYFQEMYILWQVCETLFDNDLSSENPELVYVLATGYEWNENATELTCSLRQGVRFHDGTPFNAMAVKWNFDRIYRLIESFPGLVSWLDLFILPDGRPIVNETLVINDYTVKFVLNEPFVPFLQLLTHMATSILSPTSAPTDNFIHLVSDELVGTGPFTFKKHEPHVNVILSRNQNYWGQKAKLDQIELKFYDNQTKLMDDFKSKEFHLLDWNIAAYAPETTDQFISNPEFTIQESMQPNIRYIGMNNNSINVTMRKAISYAINYSYFVENVTGNRGIRARSPIPEGCLYSNTTAFDLPDYNITHARKLLKDVGWPGTGSLTANDNVSAGNEWEMLVINDTPLETYNFSHFGNILHLRHAALLLNYLKQIGIKLDGNHTSIFNSQIFLFGWILDYNDPHNVLYPTFTYYNFMELNDSLIEQWMNDGIKETNSTLREQIYYDIQERVIEVLYPVAWTCSLFKYEIHVSNLKAFQPNPYKTLLKNAYFV